MTPRRSNKNDFMDKELKYFEFSPQWENSRMRGLN
jgi:hypothetical protein